MSNSIDASPKPRIIVNCLTPGACKSDFFRETKGIAKLLMVAVQFVIARSTEVGSRTLVAAAAGGEETHGKYMADSQVSRYIEVNELPKRQLVTLRTANLPLYVAQKEQRRRPECGGN